MDEHRKNERRKLIESTPVFDCQQNTLLGYLGNLSTQGAMLIGKKPMEVNRQIVLAIGFPETRRFPVRRAIIPSRVAWCRPEKNPHYFNIGVEFQEVDQKNKKAIEAILEKYQFHHEVRP